MTRKIPNRFHRIRWMGDTGAKGKLIRFWWYSETRYIMVRLRVRVMVKWGIPILGICLGFV